ETRHLPRLLPHAPVRIAQGAQNQVDGAGTGVHQAARGDAALLRVLRAERLGDLREGQAPPPAAPSRFGSWSPRVRVSMRSRSRTNFMRPSWVMTPASPRTSSPAPSSGAGRRGAPACPKTS